MEHNQIKFIKSLHQKKQRKTHQLFIVEGIKMVNELISSGFKIKAVYSTQPEEVIECAVPVEKINEKELHRISQLKNPNKVLAIAAIPEHQTLPEDVSSNLSLILEDIQNPGNMGTIIRLAAWYGIRHIFCSTGTVDCYNSKVVQSTMGALFRVQVHYTDTRKLISQASTWENFDIYATDLKGSSIYSTAIKNRGFIILGNESKGLRKTMPANNVKKIKLPSYPPQSENMESLNVAIATAIIVAEFRRRLL